jgi:hypothetical protein
MKCYMLSILLLMNYVGSWAAGPGRRTVINTIGLSTLLKSVKQDKEALLDDLLKALKTLSDILQGNNLSRSEFRLLQSTLGDLQDKRIQISEHEAIRAKLGEIDSLIATCGMRMNELLKQAYPEEQSSSHYLGLSSMSKQLKTGYISADNLLKFLTHLVRLLKEDGLFTLEDWDLASGILNDALTARSALVVTKDNKLILDEIDALISTSAVLMNEIIKRNAVDDTNPL